MSDLLVPLVDDGLGNSAYPVDLGDGSALAVDIEIGDLAADAGDVPDGVVVACGHGERAMTAASVLERAGRTELTVLASGPGDYAAARGEHLVR